ncbi:TetR/AcrR family transcriptional regulator [Sulfitobacter sp. JB4-11]|uniref:TetR/AcrR family transcriptional regulator n=1 Tax=Sulfitobacter rhodophyticola TaxID=3238304 RepID=UPI0035153861
MNDLTFGPLRSRDTPRQARAVARVHAILHATADILGTRAPQELTTTAIAAHAGIPVSSIYRYFPTLEDLLRELYLQTAGELREKLFAIFTDTQAHPRWQDRLHAVVATQRDYLARHPYYRPLLILFMVNRGPLAVEDEEHDELVTFLHDRWSQGGDGFHGGDARVVANTTIQIALAMEDLIAAQKDRDASRPYSAALSEVLEGYLSAYLSNDS